MKRQKQPRKLTKRLTALLLAVFLAVGPGMTVLAETAAERVETETETENTSVPEEPESSESSATENPAGTETGEAAETEESAATETEPETLTETETGEATETEESTTTETEESTEPETESPTETKESTATEEPTEDAITSHALEEIDLRVAAVPANPVHHCTKQDDGSDTTDWSYVYFGSYPQSEVAGAALTEAITGAAYDANGDAWVGGIKYRRISKSDTNNTSYFGNNAYRYFKWERIRWKVLRNDGSTLFVLADLGLDCKDYNEEYTSITWETCTLRQWLNEDFYRTAFSTAEQGAIVAQQVENADNPYYGTEGGNDTTDRVYLLSIAEVTNPAYGFCEDYGTCSASRRVQSSAYAHARGAYIDTSDTYAGNGWWWLRSPGYSTIFAAYVIYYGSVNGIGYSVDDDTNAVAPALHLNLSSDLWSMTDDGGSGDGTGGGGNTPKEKKVSSVSLNKTSATVKQGKNLTLKATVSPADATNRALKWTSSNTKVATVNSSGKVTAKNGGTAVIKATAKDGSGKSASCKITVPWKITYKLDKGKNNTKNPATYYNEKVSLKNPTRKGYVFKGWYTDKGFKKKITTIKKGAKKNYTLYAKWQKVTVKATSISSCKNSKKGQIALKYKKVSGAKGYEISYSTDKKFKKSVTKKTTSKTSFTLTKLKKGKTYYVRVRAYKVDSTGKKVYGKYTSAKKVKITK